MADERFSRLFGRLINERFTGVLRLAEGGRQYAVYWRDGAIVDAESAAPEDQAGRVALEANLIDGAAVSESIRRLARSPGRSQKDILLEMGALDAESAAKLARLVLTRRALRVFTLARASQVVSGEAHGRDDGGPVEPRWTLYRGLRLSFDERRLGDELADLQDKAVRLAPGSELILDLFGFSDEEHIVLTYLGKGYWELHDLAEACLTLPRQVVLAVIAALWAVDALDVQPAASVPRLRKRGRETTLQLERRAPGMSSTSQPAAPRAPTAPPPPPPPPPPAASPPPLSPSLAALRDQITSKFAQVEAGVDHFTLLGVGRDASTAQIKTAYFTLAKVFHPDRLAPALANHKTQVQRVFAQLATAEAALADDKRRAQYLGVLAQGGEKVVQKKNAEDAAKVTKVLAAEQHFRKAEMAMRRQQWAAAIADLEEAVKLNGSEAEHHAALAWARWCAATDKRAAFPEVKKGLEKALQINAACVPALFNLGQVYNARGETDIAYRCFQRVLTVNEKHVDAQREIRVIEMRRARR